MDPALEGQVLGELEAVLLLLLHAVRDPSMMSDQVAEVDLTTTTTTTSSSSGGDVSNFVHEKEWDVFSLEGYMSTVARGLL